MQVVLIGIVAIVVIAVVVLLYILCYGNKQFNLTQYKISSCKIPESFDGYRIAMLSDLHSYCYGEKNHELVKKIERAKPDAIMIAGDMIVKGPEFNDSVAVELLQQLAHNYPIYYANGNHEYRLSVLDETKDSTYPAYINKLKKMGIVHLVNEFCEIKKGNDSIRIVGIDLDENYYQKLKKTPLSQDEMRKLIGRPSENQYTVLLAHNPIYFPSYAKWGADLVLSGHVHGGMVSLPLVGGVMSTQVMLFPKYDAGRFEEGNTTMLLSRGLGNHTIHIRFMNRAEVLLVTLQSDKRNVPLDK